ncbi:hypothetical protein ACR776_01610 [Sphingobacterium spiritivorum]|uniref:hypothetical protein n=1 Tax=Sphingobacterium spiritivorum TaxID=258 RepID=UPI003DA2D7C6
MKRFLSNIYGVLLVALFPNFIFGQPRIISVPKNGPDTKMIKRYLEHFENKLPFDGLSIGFHSNKTNHKGFLGAYGRGPDELSFSVFNVKNSINYLNYTNAINDLKRLNFVKFKSNFMFLALFSNNWVKWDDDKNWEFLLKNFREACKIAKDSGLKGIILDTETYGSAQNLDLSFYCIQFVDYLKKIDGKTVYERIGENKENGDIGDLFYNKSKLVHLKHSEYKIGSASVTKVFLNIYKDKSNNYYYPVIDEKFKDEVLKIVNKVEQRGTQIAKILKTEFPNAEILLTCGPSYVKEVLSNIYGLNEHSTFYRTGYGLVIPFVYGMLEEANSSSLIIIDGMEQTYYHKSKQEFDRSISNFYASKGYFNNFKRNSLFDDLQISAGLFITPKNNESDLSVSRRFNKKEIFNSLNSVYNIRKLKYIWMYEENESYWFIPKESKRYYDGSKNTYGIYGDNESEYLKIIKSAIKR